MGYGRLAYPGLAGDDEDVGAPRGDGSEEPAPLGELLVPPHQRDVGYLTFLFSRQKGYLPPNSGLSLAAGQDERAFWRTKLTGFH
jgi:hypothetical protein